MLRTSSYTIYVDVPGEEERTLLVHGYTGAYDMVSRRVAESLKSLEYRKNKSSGNTCLLEDSGKRAGLSETEAGVLADRGYLTEMTVDEERRQLIEGVNRMHYVRALKSPVYIFMPTYNCNLRCFYCFQDHMRTRPEYQNILGVMDRKTVDRIFSAMPRIERLHGIDEGDDLARNIGFFGGEPLLRENRPIVEYIMNKAFSMGRANFWAVTNGTDLDAYSDLLGPEKIAHIQITLDGAPEEHDKRRVFADGSGSFEQIATNMTMALDLGVDVQVRVNTDSNNVVDLPRIAKIVIDRGWDQYPKFDLHVVPVNPHNEKTDEKTTFSTWKLGEAVRELGRKHPEMEVYRLPDSGMRVRARQIFEHRLDSTPAFKTGFCSAHDRMYIFDAFADIYACWDRTADRELRIGSIVSESGDIKSNPEMLHMWRSRTAVSNPVCEKCRYLLHCGGGCAALSENKHGTIFGNYCDEFGRRFRANVAEAFAELASGKEASKAIDPVCEQ